MLHFVEWGDILTSVASIAVLEVRVYFASYVQLAFSQQTSTPASAPAPAPAPESNGSMPRGKAAVVEPVDRERLRHVLLRELAPRVVSAAAQDVDELKEAVEYIADETVRAEITLPSADKDSQDGFSLTLDEVEAHAFYSVASTAMTELLAIPEDQVLLIIASVLEAYASYQPEQDADDVSSSPAKSRGVLDNCELCERLMPLTEHHLIPRTLHATYARKGHRTLDWLRSRANIALLCRQCHNAVHQQLDHEALASRYDTVARLLEHEGIYKWAAYASKLKERDPAYAGMRLKNKR